MMTSSNGAASGGSRLPLLIASTLLSLAACVSTTSAKTYPFVGSWECEGVRYDFTATGYSDGTSSRTYLKVSKTDRAYLLQFENGPPIVLVPGTSTGMAMVIGQGFIQDCRPL